MSISIECKKCGKSVKAPDSAAGKTGKCPACGERMVIPLPDAAMSMAPPVKPRSRKSVEPPKRESRLRKIRLNFPEEEVERDLHFKIAAWIAGGALLLLALSPLFKWIAFGAGGVPGIKGDGKFVLALSIASIAAGAVAVFTRMRFSLLILASQAWATIAVFWMGGLIWKVGSILDDPEIKDNPFAAIFATQIGPGAGLYMGLIGGLAAAGALGFIIVRHMRAKGELRHYYIAQGIAVALGIGIAVLVGPQMKDARGADRPSPFASASASRDRDGGGVPPIFTPDEPESPRVSGVNLVPSLKSKRFQKNDFQEFIWLDIDWRVAKADKPIRAVKGRLLLQDLFGETKFGIGWSINRSLRRGDTFTEEGNGFKFNQFLDSHAWVRSTEPENMKLVFEPIAVVYRDGSSEGLSEDAPRNSILRPVLQRKYFQKKDFQEYVWMDIRWETDKLPKATRAVKGVLHLTDLFGDPRFSINVTLDEPLRPGTPFLQEGTGFKYNQFMDSHHWVRAADEKDMRVVFVPESVIYADGTRETF